MSQRPAERCVHCSAPFLPGDAFCTACGWCIGWLTTAEVISPAPTLGEHGSQYRLLRKRAQGAAGTVYAARDTRSNAIVAVKVITGDPTTLSRSLREYAAGRMVKSDGIVPLLRYWLGEQCLVSVMPWIEGVSLRELLDAEGPLEVEQCVWIVREIALALAAAHQAGIIHRDVKPANILIDISGRPLLCDFGIAKLLDDPEMTGAGFPAGTPAYMSPEQLTGAVEPASDQYALGIAAYELLAGARPYIGSMALIVAAHIGSPPPAFGELVDRQGNPLPADVIEVLDRMVQKSPAARLPGLRAVADALAHRQNEDVRDAMASRVSRVRYRRFLTDRVQLAMAQRRAPALTPVSVAASPAEAPAGVPLSPIESPVVSPATAPIAAPLAAPVAAPVAAPAAAANVAPRGAASLSETAADRSRSTAPPPHSGAEEPATTTPRSGSALFGRRARLFSAAVLVLMVAGIGSVLWRRSPSGSAAPDGVTTVPSMPDRVRADSNTPVRQAIDVPVVAPRAEQPPTEPRRPEPQKPRVVDLTRANPDSQQKRLPGAVTPTPPIILDTGKSIVQDPKPDPIDSPVKPVDVPDSSAMRIAEFRREFAELAGQPTSSLEKQLNGPAAKEMIADLKPVIRKRSVPASSDDDAARGQGSILFCVVNAIAANQEFRAVIRREQQPGTGSRWVVVSWTKTKSKDVKCAR